MSIVRWVVIVLVVLAVAAVVAGQAGLLEGREPASLGVRDGRLQAPSNTANSVSSQTGLYPDHPMRTEAAVAPLALAGSGAETLAKLQRVIAAMPGGEVVRSEPGYLYARFTTRLLHYVDDAEFWFDPTAGAIQVRSASRLGSKDFGVNRARVEEIRHRLAAP